jgi:hypothetical protein
MVMVVGSRACNPHVLTASGGTLIPRSPQDEDEDQGYTQVTRRLTRATRSTSSPLNLKATRKATQRAVVRITKFERKSVVEAAQGDQLALLRNLLESLLPEACPAALAVAVGAATEALSLPPK